MEKVFSSLTARRIEPFGIELEFDFGQAMSAAQQDEFRKLFFGHALLIARDQHLSADSQARLLGYLEPSEQEIACGYISTDPDRGVLGTSALPFHSDSAYRSKPYTAISLHAVDVAAEPTVTRFANGIAAYRLLPDGLKQCVEPLVGLHDLPCASGAAVLPLRHEHRLVQRHPATGSEVLYVTQATVGIKAMEVDHSAALLNVLRRYLYQRSSIYEHEWRNGDLVIWDDLALQHARKRILSGSRTLRRISVGGGRLAEAVPEASAFG